MTFNMGDVKSSDDKHKYAKNILKKINKKKE